MRKRLDSLPIRNATFIEPMEALSVGKLPDGPEWVWEIKLDGYRALALKTGSDVTHYSRRKKSLNRQFPYIVEALADLPSGTVVDGEVVGFDENGKPDFKLLQNFRSQASRIQYHIFLNPGLPRNIRGTRDTRFSTDNPKARVYFEGIHLALKAGKHRGIYVGGAPGASRFARRAKPTANPKVECTSRSRAA